MPIEIQCQQCSARFRVGDQYAGKRVKCAKCRATIVVEAAEPAVAEVVEAVEPAAAVPEVQKPAKETAAKESGASKKPAAEGGDWFMQTEEGEQYGPVSKADLDAWVAEGRLDAGCQVLRDGWEQWKWAEEVYPQLSATPAAPPAAAEPVVEATPVSVPLPTPVVAEVSVAPVAVSAAAVAEVGTPVRGARVAARRGGNSDMNFAIRTLPICAFVAAGLAAVVALYAAYVFYEVLSSLNEVSKMTGASMTGPIIRLVLGFLVGEAAILLSGFVSFVLLRALPEWMTLSLKNDQDIQSLTKP